MPCTTHPDVEATKRCTGCAEPYCDNCLVEIRGEPYCGDCKVMAVDLTKVDVNRGVSPEGICQQATTALALSIVGNVVCCLAIVLQPIVIFQVVQAKAAMAKDPKLGGEGVANAALALAIIGLLGTAIFGLGMAVAFLTGFAEAAP